MKQEVITRWFGDGNNTSGIRKYYFYLNWRGDRPEQVGWYTSEPRGITYHKILPLKTSGKSVSVVLCGNIINHDSNLAFSDFDDVEKRDDYREYANTPLLKSHLQKCIRTGLDDKAVRTAFHLMRLDFLAFCRRLPIISAEDTATNMGIEKAEGDFKVIPLPTRNESRATRMLKGKKLENGSTISEALERVSHQSSKETAEL